jgi:predicted ATPase/DNA-binding winged helix-turn-helix (wHTH) protein
MVEPPALLDQIVSFGPFILKTNERLLLRDGVPVQIGGRTLDALIALVSHSNEVVSKKDLISWIWPDVTVEESSLRFHIATLRKALGDGEGGARYITTLAGRGYCFVAPIRRSTILDERTSPVIVYPLQPNLPNRLTKIIGRDDGILMLSSQLTAARFVTIVGAGGVGKTTVAEAVGSDLIEAFSGAVLFFDLSALSEPSIVAASLASMLGLSSQVDDPLPSLIAYLRDKRILLILDTCEHLVEAVAEMTSRIVLACSQVHIMATSREPLRVEGEHVYRLGPLAAPPDGPGVSAAVALSFPATQLFIERALARGAHFELSDANVRIIADICRKLDGLPLAIELAAGRVEAYGLQQTVELLGQHLSLLWPGQRTAPPRQKTLQATLDWSFGLLSELERVVLRWLAVFVGYFTIEAAMVVLKSATIDEALIFTSIDSLLAKSMVAPRPVGGMMRYRLLDTTRAYALQISIGESELAGLSVRHAEFYRLWLEKIGPEWPSLSSAADRLPHLAALGNVRAALEWCFSVNGNRKIGFELAAAAAGVFLAMSLPIECHRWSERAILDLDETMRGGSAEMLLQAALGISMMLTRGSSDPVHAAFNRSLAIAEERGDARTQLQVLSMLHMYYGRIGDSLTALGIAKRCVGVSIVIAEPSALALGHSLLGMSLHFTGDLSGARQELEAALNYGPGSKGTSTTHFGFNGHILVGGALARTLWLQGHPAQALDRARQTVTDAASTDHPVTLSVALIWAISVFLWTGDLQSAVQHIDWFISRAEVHSLGPYLAIGRGFRGQIAIREGNVRDGIDILRQSLEDLRIARHELLVTPFNISLIQGLTATGQFVQSIALVNKMIERVEANGDLCYLPELLRLKGAAILSTPEPKVVRAEACLRQSLEWSRGQSAKSWELRTAVDLGSLLAAQGRQDSARALLEPVFKRFVEGFETEDLRAADRLLAALNP